MAKTTRKTSAEKSSPTKATTARTSEAPSPEAQAAGGAVAGAQLSTEELEEKHRFDVLLRRLGPPEEGLREAMFEEVTEARLVDSGTEVDTDKLLKDVPIFVGSSLDILAALSEERREKVQLDDAIFPLLMDEARLLREFNDAYETEQVVVAGARAERETTSRIEMQAALAARNNLAGALRNALGEARRAKLDTLVAGPSEDADQLAESIQQLTGFALELLESGTPAERARLKVFKVTRARVEAVGALEARVRGAAVEKAPRAQRVSQRGLDEQDGRVLWLMDAVLRAFRLARRADPAILLPELRYVAGYFDLRRSRRPSSAGGATNAGQRGKGKKKGTGEEGGGGGGGAT